MVVVDVILICLDFVACISGLAHIVIDATPGTLESQCLTENQALIAELAPYNITTRKTGAIIVAWSADEVSEGIYCPNFRYLM